MSEQHSEERQWPRWRGTTEDVVALQASAERIVRLAGGTADPIIRVTGEKVRGEYLSADEFRAAIERFDLNSVHELMINVGDLRLNVRLTLRHGALGGARLSVTADEEHHLVVRGVVDDLVALIEPKVPFRHVTDKLGWAALGAGVAMLGVSQIARNAGLEVGYDVLSVVAVLFTLFAFCVLGLGSFLLPQLELLTEGATSRTTRWGRRATRFAAWALTIVVSGIVAILLDRWLAGD